MNSVTFLRTPFLPNTFVRLPLTNVLTNKELTDLTSKYRYMILSKNFLDNSIELCNLHSLNQVRGRSMAERADN